MRDTEIKTNKKELAYFMRRLYKRGLTTTSGGNISLRISDDRILITPSQTDKGRMKSTDIGVLNINGEIIHSQLKLSMETGLHLAIYKARPDINAIVHAHPPFATSFAAAHQDINTNLLSESRAILGTPLLSSYALMGSYELSQIVAETSKKTNVILMANHGIVAVGVTLLEAFDRIEVLENCAKVNAITKIIGQAQPLDPEQVIVIDKLIRL
ncbi:MAG: aldolase [Bacteroidetes bacterium HGW-Bacteroidetes-1]|jgi:L-fuculose-phosphate aldolase|nr:MAG: aldolase [Bacteroidetes bacterium HGW-Bacteroidetes-1]